MKLIIFTFVIFSITVFFKNQVSSQILNDTTIFTDFEKTKIQIRVKQLDEFFERFNFETDMLGNKIQNKLDSILYVKNILFLFNEDLFKNPSDSFINEVRLFISQIISNKIKLNYADGLWFVELNCNVLFNGKNKDITLIMKSEKIKEFEYKWVIIGAHSDFTSLKPKIDNPKLKLSPVDHDLNFMSLSEITSNQNDNIVKLAYKDYHVDELSILFYLIKTGQLKINYVDKLTYHMMQVPDFIFTINHFERSSNNVGWLISFIKRTNDSEKKKYLKSFSENVNYYEN